MKLSSSTCSSSLLSISTGCASSSFSCQGQDSRKAWTSLDTAECLSKAHKHSVQGIGCQWNCPLPHVPPPCSQSQQAVPLPPSPVRVRILEKPEIPLDTAECLSKAHKHSMQGIDCQWNRPLLRIPPPCSQSQQAVAGLPPSPVRVRILEKPEIL